MLEMTVITYGGGEILNNIFNAIAMLVNNQNDGIIRPLMVMTASISGFFALSKAFFSPSLESIFLKHFFPLIVLITVFFIPSTTVHIEDVLKNRSYKVDHVPFLLAKFSEFVSSIGYKITVEFEKVMHIPNDMSYNQTGILFGAETAMDISRYQITNADLAQNLKRFSKQCVLYDIALGKYSVDDLKKSTDLWKFFAENTSKVRMIKYCPPETSGDLKKCEYVSCIEAIGKMTPFFEKEKNYYGQSDVIKNLPLTFQVLTGLQKEKEELVGQQLMMRLLKEEYQGGSFAKNRAYTQQKNTFQIVGGLASSGLITMRGVLEALIYASFIFIFPLSFLPNGFKFFSNWIWLTIWIQLWPPCYAILNYITQTVAHSYSATIFYGLTSDQIGLSFFTSSGLVNLQEDLFALGGYLTASVPVLTYIILQGGVSSFVHMAGSLMSPSHQAASSVASEQATGNYSFANTSIGQSSFHNTSAFQKNLAPALSYGHLSENKGDYAAVYNENGTILKQSNSDLRDSLMSDDSISQSFQHQQQYQKSQMDNEQKSYVDSVSKVGRLSVDLAEHLADSNNYNESVSDRESCDVQESAKTLMSIAENFGHQHDLSTKESLELLGSAKAGLNLLVAAGEASTITQNGAYENDVVNAAINTARNDDFTKAFQKIEDFSESHAYSHLNDEGKRISKNYNDSTDAMRSSQDSYQASLSTMNQISENASWAEQNSLSIKRSLNQDFMEWGSENFGGWSKVVDVLNKGGDEADKLRGDYISDMREKQRVFSAPQEFKEPKENLQNDSVRRLNHKKEMSKIDNFYEKLGYENRLYEGMTDEGKEKIIPRGTKLKNDYENKEFEHSLKINEERNNLIEKFGDGIQTSKAGLVARMTIGRAAGILDDAGGIADFVSKPLSWMGFEKKFGNGTVRGAVDRRLNTNPDRKNFSKQFQIKGKNQSEEEQIFKSGLKGRITSIGNEKNSIFRKSKT